MPIPPRKFVAWVVSSTTVPVMIHIEQLSSVQVGSVIQLGGTWDTQKPSVLEYSIDGGQSWTAIPDLNVDDFGNWSGSGPTGTSVGLLNITVRDRSHPASSDTTSVSVVSATESITLDNIAANVRVGSQLALSGRWLGSSPPTGLEYLTDDDPQNWFGASNAVFNANGTWQAIGPTPGTLGALSVQVRRADHPSTVSNSITVNVVFADTLTLNPPVQTILGDAAQLSGSWTGTKPSTLTYSTDGGGTYPNTVGSLQTTDNGDGSGNWNGTGPTPSVVGTSNIRVRNPALTSVASANQTITTVAEILTLHTPVQVTVGNPFALVGSWQNRKPANLDYSINSGGTWTAFTATINDNGSWSGTGPTPGSAGTTAIMVRDRGHTNVQSTPVNGVAVASQTATITIDPPAVVSINVAAPLTGTWTLNRPTAMEFSINAGSSWSTVTGFSSTGTGSGTWAGNGPTQTSAGSVQVRVRDANATSVVSVDATVTATATSTITLDAPATIQVGTPESFTGTWSGNKPTAIDWSALTTTPPTWVALTSPNIKADGTWSSVGPTPNNAYLHNFQVRDHNNPTVVSPIVQGNVVSGEILTLSSPTTVAASTPWTITGTWQNVAPTGIQYSFNNFSTVTSATGFSTTTDAGGATGTWTATVSGQTAGSYNLVVQDSGNTKARVTTPIIVTVGTPQASITLDPISSVVQGNAFSLTGKYTLTQPTAAQYTLDGGLTWATVTGFSSGSGNWQGTGPTPSSAGTSTIQVRDTNNPNTKSNTQNAVATATPPPASLTLNPPPALTAGGTVSLSGNWITTKPTAMDYSIDNKATWVGITSFSTSGTTGSGQWFGNGPTTSAAGTLSIYVRDRNAATVQAGPASVTVSSSGGTTGTLAIRVNAMIAGIGVNTHGYSGIYNGNNAVNTIAAMQYMGIATYRDGAGYYPSGAQTALNNAGIRPCFYPHTTGNDAKGRYGLCDPIPQQIAYAKQNNAVAFEGANEINFWPIRFVDKNGVTLSDNYYGYSGPYLSEPASPVYMKELHDGRAADPAAQKIAIYNCTLGTAATTAWNLLRDSAGPNWNWIDRADYANTHNYSNGVPLESSLPDHVSTDQLSYLNYAKSKGRIVMPNPIGDVTTEFGYDSFVVTNNTAIAKLVWTNIVTQFYYGYHAMYIYDLFDEGSSQGLGFGCFLRDTVTPKPIATVIRNFTTIVKDNGPQTFTPGRLNFSFVNMPTGMVGAGQGKAFLTQHSSGAFYLFPWVSLNVWTGSSLVNNPPKTVTLKLTTPAVCTTYDPMVGTSVVNTSGTATTSYDFALSDTPLIIKVG